LHVPLIQSLHATGADSFSSTPRKYRAAELFQPALSNVPESRRVIVNTLWNKVITPAASGLSTKNQRHFCEAGYLPSGVKIDSGLSGTDGVGLLAQQLFLIAVAPESNTRLPRALAK
jgi:hypothetical protein